MMTNASVTETGLAGAYASARQALLNLLWEDELAKLLEVGEETLASWRKEGKGPDFTRVGKKIAYRLSDVTDWIKANVQVVNRVAA